MNDVEHRNRDFEEEALQTLFFFDGEIDGKPYKACKLEYLALLGLRGDRIPKEIQKVRSILRQYPKESLERDIVSLLTARNWRFHNIACVVMACGVVTEITLSTLWERIRLGSWVSPQLTATAIFIDPDFQSKASALISNDTTYFKSIVPLASLLSKELNFHFSDSDTEFLYIEKAQDIDRDNSGGIAYGWLESLRSALGSRFYISSLADESH